MSTFGSKIKSLRQDIPYTQDEVIKVLNSEYGRNVSKSMISKWENDKEEPSKYKDVLALAKLFNVTTDYLIGLTEDPYKTVNDLNEFKRIPILGTIAAGIPISAQEDILGYEVVDPNKKVDFCLKIAGDSMINARIYDGDIVFIRRQPEVENGEIAAVQIDGESATLKRFYNINGTVILRAENPNYKDLVYSKKDAKEITILGKAILFLSDVR